ncbi:hypothetical protein AVEN_116496-1 [Araneus ventricosus]|uniref:Uncharacterized protein n=1 Tax=Araneus ventricosus TaxID=182803 RepID=A0A4Y2NCN6_ARAVE|nr:hypothetical protein AVEN_116496-1 [Araneus ventricosus]
MEATTVDKLNKQPNEKAKIRRWVLRIIEDMKRGSKLPLNRPTDSEVPRIQKGKTFEQTGAEIKLVKALAQIACTLAENLIFLDISLS